MTSRRSIPTAALLALACLFPASSGSAQSKSAQFKVTTLHQSPSGEVTMRSEVWISSRAARADVSHPLAGKMTLLIRDGFRYELFPDKKQGFKFPLPPELKSRQDLFEPFLGLLAINAGQILKTARKTGTQNVSGYLCDVYAHSKKEGEAQKSVRIWVPQKMTPKFPVKAILTTAVTRPGFSANETVDITLSSIRLGQAIPSSIFALPKGYKITSPKPGEAPPGGKKP